MPNFSKATPRRKLNKTKILRIFFVRHKASYSFHFKIAMSMKIHVEDISVQIAKSKYTFKDSIILNAPLFLYFGKQLFDSDRGVKPIEFFTTRIYGRNIIMIATCLKNAKQRQLEAVYEQRGC